MDMKDDGIYPANLRYLSTRYWELCPGPLLQLEMAPEGRTDLRGRNWWLSELQGVSLLLQSCVSLQGRIFIQHTCFRAFRLLLNVCKLSFLLCSDSQQGLYHSFTLRTFWKTGGMLLIVTVWGDPVGARNHVSATMQRTVLQNKDLPM